MPGAVQRKVAYAPFAHLLQAFVGVDVKQSKSFSAVSGAHAEPEESKLPISIQKHHRFPRIRQRRRIHIGGNVEDMTGVESVLLRFLPGLFSTVVRVLLTTSETRGTAIPPLANRQLDAPSMRGDTVGSNVAFKLYRGPLVLVRQITMVNHSASTISGPAESLLP